MNPQKTGLFIALLRKQRGLTQSQLAEQIGVTDKAVSRWETGKGFPDVSLLEPLATALGPSVTELIAGEPMTAEEKAEHSDNAVLEALRYAGGMGRKTASLLLLLAGSFLCALPLFTAGGSMFFLPAGLLVLALSVLLHFGKFRLPSLRLRGISRETSRFCSVLSLAATLVLEALPYGAVLNFAAPSDDGTIGRFRETYSYFSMMPVGYANFFPFLCAILTVVLLFMSLWQLKKRSGKLGNTLFITTVVAAVFSLMPLILFGADFFSFVGGCITAALVLTLLLLSLANREDGQNS